MTAEFTGWHVLAEFGGVDPQLCDDLERLESALRKSLVAAGVTICDVVHKQFEPQGVTILALLSESHASIHTYPESGDIFVDVFTCGSIGSGATKAVELLKEELSPGSVNMEVIQRGHTSRRIHEPVGEGLTRVWNMSEVIVDTNTPYQHMVIAKTEQGISLFSDDDRQSTEFSQLTYHEAMLVPGYALAEKLDRVLIIGSGEGVASQMSVAAGASLVDHVDIDQLEVELCAEHLPYGYTQADLAAAVAQTGPIKMHYADGWDFLAQAEAAGVRYDMIVIDLPDERVEDAQHNRLYEDEFLLRCKALLSEGGVLAAQAGCQTMWRNETLKRSWTRFHSLFDTVVPYVSDEHEWTFIFGTPKAIADPVAKMTTTLSRLPYRAETIDERAIVRGAIEPHALRVGVSV
ncbi:adenosylmethionine decarboxylase [Nocardia otitidiscaviarum]|uniref:Polyamine aminopropyltransferase n=1 Tax=Nocardia otitidiscaviarum TaxID=1823 RepID=A0A516NNL9_9NOCA|nr:adenosylmethionine decarboxylase [Nocardia otitidiscaviarum]MBF6181329.1 adenosylmethionine decarboxylase [Nocardia otitidiscaviarum]MCP9624260.1 adenosylmethionine decarboxylase [Nocardia otitidiscaviarum]QDP80503.1 adenosylmethionine decarboxylase [Nocardia otitidiscaviarum]